MNINDLKHTVLVAIGVTIISGCAAFTPSNKGLAAIEEQRIAIVEQIDKSQNWQTNEVLLHYSVNNSAQSFSITGTLKIADRIIGSFPFSEYFNLYLTFVDDSGTGLSTHSIGPLFIYRGEVPDTLEFTKTLIKPEGAVAYTFSYDGSFLGDVGQGGGGADWQISFRPFSKTR